MIKHSICLPKPSYLPANPGLYCCFCDHILVAILLQWASQPLPHLVTKLQVGQHASVAGHMTSRRIRGQHLLRLCEALVARPRI